MKQKIVGQFIAALRKSRGMTQQNLADELHVSNKTVSKWERGDGIPDISTLSALAEIFNVTVDELVTGQKQENQNRTKGQKQIKFLINKKIKSYEVLSLISRISMIIGYVLLLTIGYATFKAIWASGVAVTVYVLSTGIILYANIQLNTFISFEDSLEDSEIQKIKFKLIKKTFYSSLLLCSLIILSSPIIFTAQAYAIRKKQLYFEELPYLFIIIIFIIVVGHLVFRFILAKKGYTTNYTLKNYIIGILVVFSFITPLIVYRIYPTYIVDDSIDTIRYNSTEKEYHELIEWKEFHDDFYIYRKGYDIVKIKGEKYYEYGENSKHLEVEVGEKYLKIFDNLKTMSRTNEYIIVNYYPYIKAPLSLDYYIIVLIVQYILVAAGFEISKIIPRIFTHKYN